MASPIPRALLPVRQCRIACALLTAATLFLVVGAPTASAATATQIGTTGLRPWGIAVGPYSYVYTANSGTNTVSKFTTPSGGSASTVAVGSGPRAVAVPSGGSWVYTANSDAASISRKPGNLTYSTGSLPVDIVLDLDGTAYTADAGGDSVTRLALDDTKTTFSGLSHPSALAVGYDRTVYVAERGAGQVTKILPDGTKSTLAALPADTYPDDIVIDPSGTVYTLDSTASDMRIIKIAADGTTSLLATFPTSPAVASPQSMTIDSGLNLYAADPSLNVVYKITQAGVVTTLASTGTNTAPKGITIDGAGKLYTANSGTNSVTKITPSGSEILPAPPGRQFVAPELTRGVGEVTVTPFESTVNSALGTPTSYLAYVTTDPAKNCTATLPARTCNVTGLTAGTTYTFATKPILNSWTGPVSPAATAAPYAVPAAPGSPVATAGDASADISWGTPADNGGTAITGFRVTASPDGATCDGGPSDTSCIVHNLANGTPYTFTVTATNLVGTGIAAGPSNSVTPRTVPSAPGAPTAIAGDRSARVNWSAPPNGGSAILTYGVTANPDGATCSANAPETACTVPGLRNGSRYTFTVAATNAAGAGTASPASDSVMPAAAPQPPGTPTVVAGDARATVSWAAPADDGGLPISTYTVTARPGSATCTATAPSTSCTIPGLANGTSYTVTVTATNDIGTSAPTAASAAVTPSAPLMPPVPPAGTESPADATNSATGASASPLRRPLVVVRRGEEEMGLPVSSDGSMPLTLACPAGGAACVMRGGVITTAATQGLASMAAMATALGTFPRTSVRAGSRRTIVVDLIAARIRALQARGVRTVPATVWVRGTIGTSETLLSRRAVRLRIPAVRTAAVTG